MVHAYSQMDKSVTPVGMAKLHPNLPTESKLQSYLCDPSDTDKPSMLLRDISWGVVLDGGEGTRAHFMTLDDWKVHRLQRRVGPKWEENDPFQKWEIYRFPREIVSKCSGCGDAPKKGQSLYPPVEIMHNHRVCYSTILKVPSGIQFCRNCFNDGYDVLVDETALTHRLLIN